MPFFYYDYTYIVFMLPAIIISLWAQLKIKRTFNKYSTVFSSHNITAREAVQRILDAYNIKDIAVEKTGGSLTDHFDPKAKVIRLSESVCDSTSVAAIGVGAHEAGHALQYALGYFPIRLRNFFVPIANFGSRLSMPLIILGIFLSLDGLVFSGIILFSAIVLFQLVTLPVEFNASRRAIEILGQTNILSKEEIKGSKKVLFAAAMTYVASAITGIMQLLRLLTIYSRKRD